MKLIDNIVKAVTVFPRIETKIYLDVAQAEDMLKVEIFILINNLKKIESIFF